MASIFLLSVVSFSFGNEPKVFGSLQVENDKIKVDVYFVALDGVGASGISNVSKLMKSVEAAVDAVNNKNHSYSWPLVEGFTDYMNVSPHILYDYGGGLGWTYVKSEFPVNASMHVVKDWATYKSIVENGLECIIVNAHGEVVPVPQGYTRESWVDKIAEAMKVRNVTWVHVGGYPFGLIWYQQGSANPESWKEAGFQRLMQHIGKGNITIPQYTGDNIAESAGLAESYLFDTWKAYSVAIAVSTDYPLKVTDFEDHFVLPLWQMPNYYAGVVIGFGNQANDTSHGFYVHFGANQTFSEGAEGLEPSEPDSSRGYFACAIGLWCLLSRTEGEILISEAEGLIQEASLEGRTQGLQLARDYLQSAKDFHDHSVEGYFLRNVYCSMVAAVEAEKPKDDPIFLWLAGLGLSLTFVGVGVVIWHKKRDEDN